MNAQEKKRDVAITALIEAGKITEDDAYPSNDINECYAAQGALIEQHGVSDQRNGVTNMNQEYVVVVEGERGNVEYVGPFDSEEEADDWARNARSVEWDWLIILPRELSMKLMNP